MKLSHQIAALFTCNLGNKPSLDFLACPWRFAQKSKAGFDGRVELKTPDRYSARQLGPTMSLDQLGQDFLQRNAVQGVARVGWGWARGHFVNGTDIGLCVDVANSTRLIILSDIPVGLVK